MCPEHAGLRCSSSQARILRQWTPSCWRRKGWGRRRRREGKTEKENEEEEEEEEEKKWKGRGQQRTHPNTGHHPRSGRGKPAHAPQEEEEDRRTRKDEDKGEKEEEKEEEEEDEEEDEEEEEEEEKEAEEEGMWPETHAPGHRDTTRGVWGVYCRVMHQAGDWIGRQNTWAKKAEDKQIIDGWRVDREWSVILGINWWTNIGAKKVDK